MLKAVDIALKEALEHKNRADAAEADLESERTARQQAQEELVDVRREAWDSGELASGLSKRVAKLQDERDEWKREAKRMTAAFKDCDQVRAASAEANEEFYKRLRACAEALGWELATPGNDTGSWQEPLPEAIAAVIAAVEEHERTPRAVEPRTAEDSKWRDKRLYERVGGIKNGV